jgi:hypothetical protein
MTFDARRIVSATGEDVVKVYDKAEGRQWTAVPVSTSRKAHPGLQRLSESRSRMAI